MCQALSKALTFVFLFFVFSFLNSPNSLESRKVYGPQFKDEGLVLLNNLSSVI